MSGSGNGAGGSRPGAWDGEGRLSDPPVVGPGGRTAGARTAGDQPAYPEFAAGTLPEWALVRQRFDPTEIGDVRAAVRAALEPEIATIRPGARVCIAAGSRGIDRIDEVVRATVERVREAGASVTRNGARARAARSSLQPGSETTRGCSGSSRSSAPSSAWRCSPASRRERVGRERSGPAASGPRSGASEGLLGPRLRAPQPTGPGPATGLVAAVSAAATSTCASFASGYSPMTVKCTLRSRSRTPSKSAK